MNTKTIITVILIVFIVGSIGYATIKKNTGSNNADDVTSPDTAQIADVDNPADQNDTKFIAYYFHGTKRCVTCNKIENFTKVALNKKFQSELESGLLEIKTLNTDEPSNEHFITDYEITTKSVVIVKLENGVQTDWKNLDKVWNKVYDRDDFIEYIQTETSAFIGVN